MTNSKEMLREDTERVGVVGVNVNFILYQAMKAQRGVEV
jgi:hypothetical protein